MGTRVVRKDRLSIGVAMLLVAGAALGLSLVADELRRRISHDVVQQELSIRRMWNEVMLPATVFFLGGLSLVGPPLLLLTARERAWGAGRLLWFAQGTASWLLWPPIAYLKIVSPNSESISGTCYYYGTPLMALYVTLALLTGGRLKQSRRRRIFRSWQETFGLFLGLAWACTGLYLIALFYRHDFFKR